MANREQRGNREKRKPKANKPKTPTLQTSPFSRTQSVNLQGNRKSKAKPNPV
jgi:hypothetical protein